MWRNRVNFTEQNNSVFAMALASFPTTVVPFFRIYFIFYVYVYRTARREYYETPSPGKQSRHLTLVLPNAH
jgi:hypothetical protein